MINDSVSVMMTAHLQELVPPTVLETTTALFGVELLGGSLYLNRPELPAIKVVRLPTQRLEVLCSHRVFVDRHARLVQDSTHVFPQGLAHSTLAIFDQTLFTRLHFHTETNFEHLSDWEINGRNREIL